MWPFSGSKTSSQNTQLLSEPEKNDVQRDDLDHRNELPTDSLFGHAGERLGMPFAVRAPLITAVSFLTAFGLGATKGGTIAADRYTAENAHRLPVSRSGWYLYHKSKNYHRLVGSMSEGTKYGLVVAGWATMFSVTEEVIDRARSRLFSTRDEDDEPIHKHRDVLSTVMAAFTVSGIYSWKQGFDRFGTARMGKISLKFSLAYGLAQDLVASLRGERPVYLDWIGRYMTGSPQLKDTAES